MFWTLEGEIIYDMQKRFIYIVNHFSRLGKHFDTDELNIKILKYMDRSWQPKVNATMELKNLVNMSMAFSLGN